jgi:uncharacterized SAM-binding protein YcdF (DUF218 family)
MNAAPRSRRSGPSRPFRTIAQWSAAVALLLAVLFRAQIFTALGSYLIDSQAPEKADAIIVLAGDYFGHRITKGGDLVRQGFAPFALISGPSNFYGNYECDLAIPFAVKQGYDENYFVHYEHQVSSTTDEAKSFAEELHRRGAHKVLLVTSDYHTRRAAHDFRKLIPDIQFIPIAAPDQNFHAGSWWTSREGQKIFLLEWQKTVATWFGI